MTQEFRHESRYATPETVAHRVGRHVPTSTASRAKYALLVLGVTLFGAALRLTSLNTRSFWLDETTAVRQATWSVAELVDRMAGNVHPLLFHLTLHAWIRAFGRSELTVRLMVVSFGIAAIPLIYWAAATIYDRRVGVIAAVTLAASPFFIWYSQEARMYTMMLFFAVLATGFMWKAIESNHWGWWTAYALSIAAGGFTQFFFFFLVAGQSAYFVLFCIIGEERALAARGESRFALRRPWAIFQDIPRLYGWLGSLVVLMLPQLWWIPKVLRHKELLRGVSQPFNYGWAPPQLGFHFNELILVPVEWMFGFHAEIAMRNLVSLWPLLITMIFIMVGYMGKVSSRTWYLMLSGIGGATVIALLGQWQPILEARYFTAATVPLVMLIARLFASFKPVVFRAVMVALVAVSLVAWADQSYNPTSIVKWDNRQAMRIVSEGYRPGDVILLYPNFTSSVPEYYLPPDAYTALRKMPLYDSNGQPRNSPAQFSQDLDQLIGPATRVWIIATWQETPRIALDRTLTAAWLERQGFKMVQDDQLRQIRISLFEAPPQKREFFIQPGATP